jgi:light-regulated signal transduction histidine kinase (bacteriophytochrome)
VVQNHQYALIKREGKWTLIESSERKRAAEEIDRLNKELKTKIIELEAAVLELDAFSYSVSHDLRAPLRSIGAFSHELLEDYSDKLDENGKNSLARIRAASQRMGALIDSLLTLSRISRSDLKRGPVNLSAMALEIASLLESHSPAEKLNSSSPRTLLTKAMIGCFISFFRTCLAMHGSLRKAT